MPFACPMYWMEIVNHENCYFCKTNVSGFNKKNKSAIQYADVSSVIKPIPYNDNEDGPLPKKARMIESDKSSGSSSPNENVQTSKESSFESTAPKLFSQQLLNDFVRNMSLSKIDSQICGRFLGAQNLLMPECSYSWYRDRQMEFLPFFKVEDDVTFCCDVE